MVPNSDHEMHISGHESWSLISLSVEDDYMFIGYSLLDGDLEHLLHLADLVALTVLAPVLLLTDFTLALTLGTVLSQLLIHAGSQHDHLLDHSPSLTLGAGAHVLSALPVAGLAHLLLLVGDVHQVPVVGVLQADLQLLLDALMLLGPLLLLLSSASTTTQEVEDIENILTTSSASLLESLNSVLIVYFSLLGIAQHFLS